MRMTCLLYLLLLFSCSAADRKWVLTDSAAQQKEKDSLLVLASQHPEQLSTADTGGAIVVPLPMSNTTPAALVDFAETLVGTPYAWASTDPAKGFDCSGFISYVFGHFDITVPRSSIDFTSVGEEVAIAQARRGDIILFTGTDPLESNVGHMGLVVSNNADGLRFIHSTSGKEMAVTITKINEGYRRRFVAVRRLF
jgi:cell wall-associated NlpC family hydrolase